MAQNPSGNPIKNQVWLSESIFTQWVSQMVVLSPEFSKSSTLSSQDYPSTTFFACDNGTQIFNEAVGLVQSKHLMKDINILKDV